MAKRPLTFAEFQALNARRSAFHFTSSANWGPNDWACALAGEVGELCNVLKKVRRGDSTYRLLPREAHWTDVDMHHARNTRAIVLKELADVITYADALITHLGADTETVLLEKFDEVSKRVGFVREEIG
jgi:NTP pyrophosphatase (non-canonical NTP hydrolase)